jgi:hypothetical protein
MQMWWTFTNTKSQDSKYTCFIKSFMGHMEERLLHNYKIVKDVAYFGNVLKTNCVETL